MLLTLLGHVAHLRSGGNFAQDVLHCPDYDVAPILDGLLRRAQDPSTGSGHCFDKLRQGFWLSSSMHQKDQVVTLLSIGGLL